MQCDKVDRERVRGTIFWGLLMALTNSFYMYLMSRELFMAEKQIPRIIAGAFMLFLVVTSAIMGVYLYREFRGLSKEAANKRLGKLGDV